MVIPKKIGNYSFELDDKTIKVDIQKDVTRVSKMDLITRKRNTGGYENITSYKVTVIDGSGNVVETLNTSDESEYFEFMNSLYCSNSSFDPQNLFNEVYKYINSKATIPIGAAKITKIGDNFIKAVYPFECFKDDVVNEIITNLTNMGCTVKQLKDKKIRSFNCKVFSILIPKTIKLKENITMNKKLIRLTESDLHRIVKESVEKILSESEYDNFFDWADNSSASPEEIGAASQRHDSRIPSIKSPTDKLARRERVFNRRASMNDLDIGERIANRKDFIKNQRQGEKFRNRITR